MTEGTHSREGGEHLVAMVNDIGNYFRAQGRDEAVAGIANHIKRYWTPRMRQKLNAYLNEGNGGLDDFARAAIDRLNGEAAAASSAGTVRSESAPGRS
jgi:formate dehydrogenase subunit delta